MGSRNEWQSSLNRSIAAYYPNWPPPNAESLQSNTIRGSSPFYTVNPWVHTETSPVNSAVVLSRFMNKGMRFLYSRGAQLKSWFSMRATGQVESTRFQPILDYTWAESFNDFLYRPGGYPQNFGLTFKVASIPSGIATSDAWGRMRPTPRFARSIYTNRSFATAPAVPAQPINIIRRRGTNQ